MRDPVTGWLGRLARPATVMAVVFIAMIAPAPRAEASCGDYIVIGNPSAEARSALHAMDRASDRGPAAPPCDGPQCRGRRSTPSPTPAAPAPTSISVQPAVCTQPAPTDLTAPVASAAAAPTHLYRSVPLSPGEKPPPTQG